MIGKYIVYQGVFKHRWSIAFVTGETPNFWKVEDLRWASKSKIGKQANPIDYATEVSDDAIYVQETLNDAMISLDQEMKARKAEIINRVCKVGS